MKLCMIGAGHVGLVSAACFADLGNEVICVDSDEGKISILKKGTVPFFEPGLEELVRKNAESGRLSFTANLEEGVKKSEIVFIAVGTPSRENGEADLSFVEDVSCKIAEAMEDYKIIVEKSTVPVKTGEWVKKIITNNIHGVEFDVVSNPEFLREGSAIQDFMHPDRIVIGVETERAKKVMTELYKPLNVPLVITDIKSAEIIKHASNSFLALKISYINAIANICEKVGADVKEVSNGMELDGRIGKGFLRAGLGYGGSCFPKDVAAFTRIAEEAGYNFELLKVTEGINRKQKELFLKKVKKALWTLNNKVIGILGLSFKPNTDDMREAPSVEIINRLQAEGAKVRAYDPAATENARKVLKDIEYCADPYRVAEGSDCLLIITEWEEFKKLDLGKIKSLLKNPIIVDGRNVYEPEELKKMGFNYFAVGR
ncbi:UDP-glucose/GDP-mannose dehydrogenase family protein [candidate division NPL-UPA2 bacterium]|nr:UDP-glucose/GDP-mannose dehydrogenase family protein [candidate division NPL-UPA2 bacterium]